MNGQSWELQQWHQLWQQWEGGWQGLWQKWEQDWQWMFQQYEHHHHQQQFEQQQQLLGQPAFQQHQQQQSEQLLFQQQWSFWSMQWQGQFAHWKQHWQWQWGEWQLWRQTNQHSWKQHQQQWEQWRRQSHVQWIMWQQQTEQHWHYWQVRVYQPQLQEWQQQWNVQWSLWQQQWLGDWSLWQQQWHHEQQLQQQVELHQLQQEQLQWDEKKPSRRTKRIRFIRLSEVLGHRPLTRPFVCDGVNMSEKTDFGALIADGYVNEVYEAHKVGLSWGGLLTEDDLYITDDGCFVSISKTPREEATAQNKCLDFTKITTILLSKYIRNGVMPHYLQEFLNRVDQLKHKSGRALLVSLWVLRNHPFLLDTGKWSVFFEDFYKWYKTVEIGARTRLIQHINQDICRNWHLSKVRGHDRLFAVYWSDRKCPKFYYVRDFTKPRNSDVDHTIYPYTSEDGYLAVFHRVFFVHGPHIFKNEFLLKELIYMIAHIFETFLPCFIEEIYDIAEDHPLIEEALIKYIKRKSHSWKHNEGNLYDHDATPSLDL